MENRVRDLEQIQERDGDDRGRRIGALLMAALALVGLTFAIGVVVGRAAEPDVAEAQEDPLAKLDRAQGTKAVQQTAPAKSVNVNAADLSFPSTLSEAEDRPEVIAALQAAAAEEAVLAKEQGDEPAAMPAAQAAPSDGIPTAAQVIAQTEQREAEDGVDDEEVSTEELVASVPAAVAAGSAGRSLPKAMRNDPMVANAIRSGDDDDSVEAAHGHDGEVTLQVISYDSPEPARAFAAGLRDKGHEAFVTSADVTDRGRFYRVRVGPFKSRELAETYRHKFEQEEHMNTFVVRRKDD